MSKKTNITNASPEATTPHVRNDGANLKTMLYAIACIQSLPGDRQERSDMLDMCALARSEIGFGNLAFALYGVESHVGHQIDLWPAHGGSEIDGSYSDEELDTREAVREGIDYLKSKFASTGLLIDAPPSNVVKFLGEQPPEGEAA